MEMWSPTAIAKAPPEPPSPIIFTSKGVLSEDISNKLLAIASL